MTNLSKQSYHVTKQIEDYLDMEDAALMTISQHDMKKVNSLLNQALAILKYGDRRQ